MTTRFGDWLDTRTGWRAVWEGIFLRKVPKINWLFTLGSASLFVAVNQIVPGVLLTIYYVPTPDHAYDSVQYILEHGLVLVTGPTGSGKTTTLAPLMKRILARRSVHVITIEDPVEYEHPHGASLVEHVEIGRDATSFAQALRAALRQNPDVLLVGEMRDRESISITVTAAETGHLVLSTLLTGDAPQTVSRILDTYPAGQLEAVRAQLAASLAAVLSQQLLPRPDGQGRVPAVEFLWGTHGVRNLAVRH